MDTAITHINGHFHFHQTIMTFHCIMYWLICRWLLSSNSGILGISLGEFADDHFHPTMFFDCIT